MFNTKRGNGLAWLIVIVAILIILFLVFRGGNSEPADDDSADHMEDTMEDSGESMEKDGGMTITYTDNGFSPNPLTVSVGDTVKFVNDSSHDMWVASAQHPTHTAYSDTTLNEHCPDADNTAFDQCEELSNGESWEFTFDKEGEWAYHNHMRSSDFGKVVVEAK